MQENTPAARRPCLIRDLGRRPYSQVLALQQDLVRARQDQELEDDVLLLVEHDPVFTLGRQGRRDSLLVSETLLSQQGIAVEHIERGGDITYHGPGQIVAYLIMDLRQAGLRVTAFVSGLEEVMLRTARDLQVQAGTDPKNRGLWVQGRKLGSVGIAVRHGITFHGLALNVNTDLSPFSYINPCGLTGVKMTSLAMEKGQTQDFSSIKENLAAHMQEVFSLQNPPGSESAPPLAADAKFDRV
ncbi:MAG: lipoyl(octanoyl) transferase LipB [Desulfovermiculus sp.]|nr:lipoyl(octanoyl) transferase LipB [Desulfovermiculus sp.]